MKGKILILIAAIALGSYLILNINSTSSNVQQFKDFQQKFGKVYETMEEQQYRKNVFLLNLAKIATHNSDPTQNYKLGITPFADLTQEQFISQYLNYKPSTTVTSEAISDHPLVGSVDWANKKRVPPVVNQGQCGSSYAFGAVHAVDSLYMIKNDTSTPLILSVQQILDCSGDYGNYGCNGGWMNSTCFYIRDKGLVTEKEYPYVGRNQPCKMDGGPYKIKSYIDSPGCDATLKALKNQPLATAVDASNWYLYKSGIFDNCKTMTNHGIFLVAYHNNQDQKYWKLQNFWTQDWGEQGYIRLADGNTCGLCNYAGYPAF